MSEELKAVADDLKSTWEDAKAAFDRQAEEIQSLGTATGETKQVAERLDTRLDDLEARMEKLHLDAVQDVDTDEQWKSAFAHYLRKGSLPEGVEAKDITVGTDTQAGFFVPTEFVNSVIRGITDYVPFRQYADVMSIGAQSLQIPKRTGATTATWRGETESFTETSPTVGLEEIPTHELGAFVDVSLQLLEDSVINIETYLREELTEAFADTESTAFVNGTGVGRPEGFLQNSSVSSVTTATNDTFAADDIITLFYTPKSRYAANGTFMANRGIIKAIRQMKGSDNNYLWQPGLAPGEPPTLMGRPLVEVDDMASAVADAAKVLAFGDFRRAYKVVDRIGMVMVRDNYTQMGSGLVRFYARRRVGGQVVLPEAIDILVVQ